MTATFTCVCCRVAVVQCITIEPKDNWIVFVCHPCAALIIAATSAKADDE